MGDRVVNCTGQFCKTQQLRIALPPRKSGKTQQTTSTITIHGEMPWQPISPPL
jgi:hypothetical protein